jgi:plastocyanin
MQAMKLLVLILAFSGASQPVPGPAVVDITPNMTFMPKELSVMVGEVVVWKNTSKEPHSVNTVEANCKTEDGKKWIKIPAGAAPFFSGEIKPGEEFRARFEIPGTYQYLCTFHEHASMRGTIVVQGAEVK